MSAQGTPNALVRVKILALLPILMLIIACGPRCLRGHYKDHHYATMTIPRWIRIGKVSIYSPLIIPAHDGKMFVCDEIVR